MKGIVLFVLCGLIAINANAQLYINEVIPSNDNIIADNYGEYDDIIEIYNAGNAPVNLAGYYLSDDTGSPLMWQIPATDAALTTVPANGYLIFWADNETAQGANHLNFKLSGSGESIILTNPDGFTIEDSFTFSTVITDQGYGRLPDGSATLSQLIPATPAATNDNSQPQATPPIISPTSGLYNTAQTVIITAEPGASIYYTLDGAAPTTSATLYTGAFTVNTSQSVRAISVLSGFANSLIETAAYIIGTNHDLAVLSVNLDPEHLWSDNLGMYVVGTNGVLGCDSIANYNQDWEYLSNVMMFDEAGNQVFDVDGGLSIFGNCSRRYAQKSIQLKTKSQYPSSNIPAQVFPQREQHEFRRLRFRNGGAWKTNMMTDAVTQSLVENQVDLEIQSARPSVVYLNGEYWGVHNIRDAYSQHYFRYKFPKYEDDDFDMIRFRELHTIPVATMGTTTDISNLYQYFNDNLNFSQSNYEYAESRIDLNNFMNYYMLQMWAIPLDWPGTGSPSNEVIWRSSTSNSKWRMAVLDTDVGWRSPNHNTIDYMMIPSSDGRNSPNATLLFRRLMDVPEFRDEFIQRYATQFNLLYNPNRVNAFVDQYKNTLDSEMTNHTALWGPQEGVADYNTWVAETNNMKAFADVRSDSLRTHIANFFGLSTFDLSLNFDANTKGSVVVNSNYFEVPYNYTGEYFTDTPIEIHAIPDPGYRFAYWQETGNTDATLYQSFTSNTTLTPVFEPALDVVINEIHYHPDDTINNKEFIEIHNPDTKARDLSDYEFSEGICFKFPQGTTIAAGEYIVVAADATQYAGNGYQVFEWEESKLSNDGEKIWLNNVKGTVIDSVRYNDGIPWALLADGFGASLELNYPVPADNIAATDWHASDPTGGTPGAQNSAPCTTPTDEIVINEINYNSDNLTNPGDWIELHNPNSTSVDISNWQFYDSENTFTIPAGTILDPDDFLILAEDAALFGSIFPHLTNGTNYIGDLMFNLSNGGERLSLFDPNKCLVDELTFNDKMPWDTIPDGNGPTLSLISPNSDNTLPQSWEASSNIGSVFGTPGRANEPCPESIIELPSVICAGFPAEIKVDSAYSEMTFTWFASGATPSTFTTSSDTLLWNTPGTYNLQLITKYFECIKVYTQSITVEDCNTAPNIVDDNFTINEDNILSDNVLTNDNDPNNNNLIVNATPLTNVSNGTLTLNSDGTFDYTPNPDFYGTDSFTYRVCDDATVSSAIVSGVGFVGAVASGADDAEELAIDGSIDIMSSDLDLIEDNPEIYSAIGIRITNITIPQGAVVTNAYLEFVADEAQTGATSLAISAEATGNAATIPTTAYALTSKTKTTATASWSNLPAWTVGNTYQSADISSVVQEIINRGDWASGNAMTFIIEGTGRRTAESFDGTAAPKLMIDYEVITGINQIDVSLCDIAEVTINVASVNDTPIALNDNAATMEDMLFNGDVSTNDSDIEGDNLMVNVTPIMPAQNGSLTLLASGSYTYTPNPNFYGTDTFTYEICDDGSPAMCDTASVTIDVASVNDAPLAQIDIHQIQEDAVISGDVLANDSDIENHTLTVTTTPVSNISNGILTLNANGTFIYTPNANFSGFDSFTYEVCDNGTPSECSTATVNINIIGENDAPIATDDTANTTEDMPFNGDIATNDSDIEGDNLMVNVTPIMPAQNGSLTLLASGSYTYTPNQDFYGTDSFTYEICDDGNPVMCDTASVTINITPVNDAPVPMPDTLYMFANSTIQHNVLLNDSDIENDNLTAAIIPMVIPSNGSTSIQPNGNINYTPIPNFVGTDSFTYEVCDDGTPSMCNTSTVVIIIEPDCVDIELAAWLEGAYEPALGEMRTTLVATRKLLPGQTPTSNLATPTPAGQPYNTAPWNYTGTEGAAWTDADYTGDETDWVLVSFRTDIAKNTEVGMTAALLMKDGSITFPDRCALTSTVASPLYIIVEHRNHIGIMTPQPVDVINSTLIYDFRSSDSYRDPTSFGQKQLPTGEWTMYAGDANQSDFPSYDIQGTDKTLWFDNNGVFDYYFSPDFNLDGDINGQDKSLWFDNNGISSRVPK